MYYKSIFKTFKENPLTLVKKAQRANLIYDPELTRGKCEFIPFQIKFQVLSTTLSWYNISTCIAVLTFPVDTEVPDSSTLPFKREEEIGKESSPQKVVPRRKQLCMCSIWWSHMITNIILTTVILGKETDVWVFPWDQKQLQGLVKSHSVNVRPKAASSMIPTGVEPEKQALVAQLLHMYIILN